MRGKGVHWLFWTASLTAILTPWFGSMKYLPVWTAFTLPAVILVFFGDGAALSGIARTPGRRAGGAAALFFGLWQAYLLGLDLAFLFVYPFLMTVLLYWVRWQATRPPRPGPICSRRGDEPMKRRDYLWLFLTGLASGMRPSPRFSIWAWSQHGCRLLLRGRRAAVRMGHGFTEVYLWNYLDDPQSPPHPSHGYWFPLASILAAAGMWLTGSDSFYAGRLGFLLVAALIPPVSAALAFSFTQKRPLALVSGVLGMFCGYHAPFLRRPPIISGIFMLLGALFFLLFPRSGLAALACDGAGGRADEPGALRRPAVAGSGRRRAVPALAARENALRLRVFLPRPPALHAGLWPG